MRHPRTIIGGIGLAAMAAAGGVTAVSAGGSLASSAPSAGTAAVTVRTAPAAVGRSTGAILVKAQAAAVSTPGSLDPTFGNGGKVLYFAGNVIPAVLYLARLPLGVSALIRLIRGVRAKAAECVTAL